MYAHFNEVEPEKGYTMKVATAPRKLTPVSETEENIDRVNAILQLVIDDKRISDEEGRFWDSCYPWVSTNEETIDLLQEAYQHL